MACAGAMDRPARPRLTGVESPAGNSGGSGDGAHSSASGAAFAAGAAGRGSPVAEVAASQATARRFRLTERAPGEPGRERLEGFVAEAFARAHGATVQAFMPSMLGLEDGGGRLRCVLGYRGADSGELFLERYLEWPIEVSIARAAGVTGGIPRASIVEVGNLAGRGCRAAMHLVARLPRLLGARGFTWVSFTATTRVRELLAAFGAPLLDLGPADPARLGAEAREWGRYYATQPRVVAGWLPHGLADRL